MNPNGIYKLSNDTRQAIAAYTCRLLGMAGLNIYDTMSSKCLPKQKKVRALVIFGQINDKIITDIIQKNNEELFFSSSS